MSQYEYVSWERREQVALVTLDRPGALNALSVPLVRETARLLDELEADGSLRSVVLCGAGRAFSAGGDLADVGQRVAGGEPEPRLETMRQLHILIARLRESPLPVVAAVAGPAYGAGWSTVLACDLVVAARDARFCQVFVRRNLVPDLGSAWFLPRAVGVLKAKELMLLGGELPAAEAFELGLVNRLVETREDAIAAALALAEQLAAVHPGAARMAKHLINRSQALTLEDSLALERHAQSIALGTPETLAAMQAFLAKRVA